MGRAIIQRETAEGLRARHCPALARNERIAVRSQWRRPGNPGNRREVI
jgi:hypothetical protein